MAVIGLLHTTAVGFESGAVNYATSAAAPQATSASLRPSPALAASLARSSALTVPSGLLQPATRGRQQSRSPTPRHLGTRRGRTHASRSTVRDTLQIDPLPPSALVVDPDGRGWGVQAAGQFQFEQPLRTDVRDAQLAVAAGLSGQATKYADAANDEHRVQAAVRLGTTSGATAMSSGPEFEQRWRRYRPDERRVGFAAGVEHHPTRSIAVRGSAGAWRIESPTVSAARSNLVNAEATVTHGVSGRTQIGMGVKAAQRQSLRVEEGITDLRAELFAKTEFASGLAPSLRLGTAQKRFDRAAAGEDAAHRETGIEVGATIEQRKLFAGGLAPFASIHHRRDLSRARLRDTNEQRVELGLRRSF